METIIKGIVIFILMISILEIIREGWRFFICYKREEVFNISDKRLYGLWSAIAYIMTLIFI